MTGVSSNTSITVTDISNTAEVITGNIIRQRAKFQRADQTVAISGLPNQGIKDISQVETEIIRRQKNITVASNTVTMSASDGTFVAFSEDDYHVALPDGSKLALNDTGGTGQVTGAGTNSVVINVGSVTGVCKVIATLQRATPTINAKTFVEGACITVNSASVSNNYGIGFQDKDISLGVADVYAIRGIYEGGDALNPTGGSSASDFVTTPLPPSFTYTPDAGSNALNSAGTEIVGVVSGARGVLIDND